MIRKSVRFDNICYLINNKSLLSLLSGGGQRQSMHVIPNTRIHQQITNIVYSEPRIGVNENFNILEY